MSRESEIAIEHALAPTDIGKSIPYRLYPTHDEIARLAFGLYEARGRQDGYQIEDWLRAEQELAHHYA